MTKSERMYIINQSRLEQKNFFCNLLGSPEKEQIAKKINNFNNKFNAFLRCEFASKNSLKRVSQLSSIIFSCMEYQKQKYIPQYEFKIELSVINKYLVYTLDTLLASKYNHHCPLYGESLLNCYLDLYITFTNNLTDKKIDAHPDFLINPLTGSNLELDVLFSDFKLAFEFQGEHHYTDASTQYKDNIKLMISSNNNHILIPINISQLSHRALSGLICNSIKEQQGLTALTNNLTPACASKKVLLNYCRIIQRCYLAHELYRETLNWLDEQSQIYINGRTSSSPVSALNVAPRINHLGDSEDLDIDTLYFRLPKIQRINKSNNKN